MEALTLSIATVSSILIFLLRPIYGLIIYVAVMVCYPMYLTIPIGTIDFTVCRIVILAIFANIFLRTNLPRQFKFIWLDKLIIIYFVCQAISGLITSPSPGMLLENRAGAVFDMVLPYFAVRMIIQNKRQYLTLLKGVLIISAPLAIIGLYQCITGNNPVGFLMKYNAWEMKSYVPLSRIGLFRANVTFSVSIMFGLFFAMFGPLCAGILRNAQKNKMLYWLVIGLMGIGIFSSMSSGPMLAVILSVLFLAFYRWRKDWKLMAMIVITMCGAVEIISNRHFYDVLGGFTLSPATAWYRSKLIDVALFEGGMSEHWLTGFGLFVDPGWGLKMDGRIITDVVNHYLLILAYYGLIGFVPFLCICIMVVKKLIDAYKASMFDSDRWLVWCLAAGLFGLAGALMSVSLFGQPATIFYMMIGFVGIMPSILRSRQFPTDIIELRQIGRYKP
jgi:hypothetical protein